MLAPAPRVLPIAGNLSGGVTARGANALALREAVRGLTAASLNWRGCVTDGVGAAFRAGVGGNTSVLDEGPNARGDAKVWARAWRLEKYGRHGRSCQQCLSMTLVRSHHARRGSTNCASPSRTLDSGNQRDAILLAGLQGQSLISAVWYLIPRHCPLTPNGARRGALGDNRSDSGSPHCFHQAVPCL